MVFDEVVRKVVALGAPVVCADTCSILDVMRDPTRDDARVHNAIAALHMVAKMEANGELVCLLAEQVKLELADHLQPIQDEAKKRLSNLTDRVNRVNTIAALFGPGATVDLAHFVGHEVRARAMVDRWINVAEVVPQRPEIAGRAVARVIGPRAPARQGKDSTKDCIVIETYFDMIRALRGAGLQSKIVFLSSNTTDYTNSQHGGLHDDLKPDFAALSIEYAPNAGAARHALGV